MEVLSPQNQSSEDWQSLDDSWDSRLPTPLALDFSSLREDDDVMPNTDRSLSNGGGEDYYMNSHGYQDYPATPDSQRSVRTSNGFIEGDTEYLQMARKGGGHSEMMTVSLRPQSSPDSSIDIETDTEYLKIAKKGGGRKDLLTIEHHSPTPEPVTYDKTDGQWYTHDGVDVKESQQRKDLSLALNGLQINGDDQSAAGGKQTGYLDLAKKGGGRKDLLTVEDHTPSPEPLKYEKKGGDWYNQDDMVIKDGPQDTGEVKKRRRTFSDSECKAETEYLRTARKGGGHKDLLTIDPQVSNSPEPVKYEKKDGQWYTHDGVDVKDTQERKEMVTVPSSPRRSSAASSIDIETNTDYLKIAKKGGGHKDLLTIDHHTPTPEPVKYDKTDGQWYTHDGVDVKESQQKKEMVTVASSPRPENLDSSMEVDTETNYLKIAKKGGGHKDLLIIDHHTPTPEPVKYDKADGQWYTHDGVDVKDTQQRKEMVTVASSPRPENLDSSMEVDTETNYLKIAKKGGGHKDLLTVEPHTPRSEPVTYDKTDGQWYTHDGVDVRSSQQRKELAVTLEAQQGTECLTPAGGNNTDYLDLAKKGGGHKDLLTVDPHTPTSEPVRYDKTDGQWYTHDGVNVKESQQRRESTVSVDDQSITESAVAAGCNNREYLELAKKGGGHQDLLTIEDHTPTPEPVRYDKRDGQWYTHDGVDVKETQQRRDLSMTLESIPEDMSTAGEVNGEYLEMARKGGRKDLLTIEPHTPRSEPVTYDKTDGQWYTHDGVDVQDTQQRKEMVTVASSPRSPNLDSSVEVDTETHYLKIAKKGGGHKDLLTIEPHTPTPEPVKYNKGDGQWYTHDGVDVKDTQQRKEMVTVAGSPRPSSAASSVNIETETDYLKIAKKGGGHKDLLTLEPHTPRSEPVKYDKTDGQWYTHDGVDVKDTQQRKEMVTVSNSPRSPKMDSSFNIDADTEYLKIAKKGGGHKDLLTMEPHTPSPAPQRYQKNGGNWFNQNGSPASPSPRKNNASDTDYLILARKGGGHSDLLTTEPHTPTSEPVRYDKKDGQWYTHDGVDVKETQQRKDTPSPRRSPRKNARDSKIPVDISTNTEYLKIARKGGGHKDLLTHTPSPETQRYPKKGGEVNNNNQDIVDGNKTRDRKAARQQNGGSSVQINTETEYLQKARKGGGHKDLLTIEHHKPSPRPKKQESKLGGWYYQDGTVVKDTLQRKESPATSPRKTSADSSPASTEYLKMARKGGGRKDLLMMTPEKASPSPKPKEVKRNIDSTPVSSPRSISSAAGDSTDYLRLARKGGGHPDLLSSAPRQTSSPVARSFDTMDTPRRKEPSTDSPLRRSASMRHRGPASNYLNIARKGGHHKDLLTMPEEPSNFQRDQASRRSLRSFRSPVISQVDGPPRPRTAEPRQSHPIWLGGSGPERVHTPRRGFVSPAPFAYHQGSPGVVPSSVNEGITGN
ncbi:uncharacterized protein LOC144630857 isoform X5 [Oculina patagonica]